MSKAAALPMALKHLEKEAAFQKESGQTGSWRMGSQK